jgi:hypothetical protein
MKYTIHVWDDDKYKNIKRIYTEIFKEFNITPTNEKNKWTDYDIMIYLKASPLNFGKYTLYPSPFKDKDKIQNDKNGYINRIPIGFVFMSKHILKLNNYSFYPESVTVYSEKNKKSFDKYPYWIIKPSRGAQGLDIIISSNKDIEKNIESYKEKNTFLKDVFPLVVQRYITNPMLLDGHKFDFRVYVLFMNNKLYINKYYYVRLAAKKYDYSNPTDMKAGLTNFSMHQDIKYMWPKKKFLKVYEKEYPDNKAKYLDESLLLKFANIVNQVFDHVRKNYSMDFLNDKKNNYFHLFGFDFLPDETGKLWLLEANTNPGAGDTRKDSQAQKVIRDMIRLVLGQKNYSFIQLSKIQDSL